MSDDVAQFLKACEYAKAQTVQKMLSSLGADFNILCTQGAIMATGRQKWETVHILAPHVDIAVSDFIMVRTTCAHKQWECLNALLQHVNANNCVSILDDISSSLFSADAVTPFKQILSHVNTLPHHLETLFFSLATNALQKRAFRCLDALITTGNLHKKDVFQNLSHYVNMLDFRQPAIGIVLLENLNDFETWRQKNTLETHLGIKNPLQQTAAENFYPSRQTKKI